MTICCWHWICDNDHRLLELEDDKDATETLSIRTSRLMRIWTMIIDLLLVLLEKKTILCGYWKRRCVNTWSYIAYVMIASFKI